MKTEKSATQTRRTFVGCLARTLATAGVVAGASRESTLSAQDKQKEVLASIVVADHPELEKVGGFVLVKNTSVGELLIVRSGEERFSALSNVCPHRHCRVEVLGPEMIKCPCHHSTYKINGTYVSGPAKRSLSSFPVAVERGVLTVTAS